MVGKIGNISGKYFRANNSSSSSLITVALLFLYSSSTHFFIPRCHFEDITRADFYGFVVPFANKLMDLSNKAKIPIKIRACDTLGLGVSYPGAALPRCVQGIIYGLRHYSGVPSEWIEWHGHNDFL